MFFICISFSRSNRNIGLRIRNICVLHHQQKGPNYLGRCNYLKDWDGLLLLCTTNNNHHHHHLSLSFNSKMTFQTLRLVNSSFSVKITGFNHQSKSTVSMVNSTANSPFNTTPTGWSTWKGIIKINIIKYVYTFFFIIQVLCRMYYKREL